MHARNTLLEKVWQSAGKAGLQPPTDVNYAQAEQLLLLSVVKSSGVPLGTVQLVRETLPNGKPLVSMVFGDAEGLARNPAERARIGAQVENIHAALQKKWGDAVIAGTAYEKGLPRIRFDPAAYHVFLDNYGEIDTGIQALAKAPRRESTQEGFLDRLKQLSWKSILPLVAAILTPMLLSGGGSLLTLVLPLVLGIIGLFMAGKETGYIGSGDTPVPPADTQGKQPSTPQQRREKGVTRDASGKIAAISEEWWKEDVENIWKKPTGSFTPPLPLGGRTHGGKER